MVYRKKNASWKIFAIFLHCNIQSATIFMFNSDNSVKLLVQVLRDASLSLFVRRCNPVLKDKPITKS